MKNVISTRSLLLSSSKNAGLHQLNELEAEQLKKILLEMYKDIVEFCEENHLCVMLGGGSVLGSIRHGGFIPWDDDLDLMMPRESYNRFAEIFEEHMGDKYELFLPDGKHLITNLFMKVSKKGTIAEDIYTVGSGIEVGITIDIFPMENVPSNVFVRKCKGGLSNIIAYVAVSVYMYCNKNKYMKASYCGNLNGCINYMMRMVLGALFSWWKYEKWYQMFDKFAQSTDNSGLYTIPTGRKHYNGEIQEEKVFFPPQKTTFEGVQAYIPRQVDVYLNRLYGDYMKLPPLDQREKHFYTKIEF